MSMSRKERGEPVDDFHLEPDPEDDTQDDIATEPEDDAPHRYVGDRLDEGDDDDGKLARR